MRAKTATRISRKLCCQHYFTIIIISGLLVTLKSRQAVTHRSTNDFTDFYISINAASTLRRGFTGRLITTLYIRLAVDSPP